MARSDPPGGSGAEVAAGHCGRCVLDYQSLYAPAREFFGAYNEFLGILDAPKKRKHLERLRPEDAHTDRLYEEVQSIGGRFQGALEDIFFKHEDTPIPELTRRYGVF